MNTLAALKAVLADRYAIDREIGRGGMATVYLAEDLRHGRRVAIKVLHPDLGAVLGVERFLTEIRVTAALQHPNLLPLFDSGEVDGQPYYVMPFVGGESLRARLTREPQLPVDGAVRIAAAIAGALDYAHRHGVVHRDLKPENILLHEGQPLVADFGIALAVTNAAGSRLTRSGVSLGTPQYMAPEQAAGDHTIDGRADVYALGVILYEMLAGEPPHSGPTMQAVVARIKSEKPRRLRTVREAVPEHVEIAVDRALAKLPADRFGTAAEFAEAVTRPGTASRSDPGAEVQRKGVRRWIVLAGAVAIALAAGTMIGTMFTRDDKAPRTALRFPLALPQGMELADEPDPMALSPDGTVIALIVRAPRTDRTVIMVRSVDDSQPRELAGTDGATQLFFSPDGRWLAFYVGSTLRKLPVGGGTSVVVGEVPELLGASWVLSDQIVVSSRGRLATVPAAGGAVRPFSAPRGDTAEFAQILPRVLPDRRTIIYTSRTRYLEQSTLSAARLGDSVTTALGIRGTAPLGMVEGMLIVATARNTTERNDLVAVPFDLRRQRVTGLPTPVINDVTLRVDGSVRAALSETGALLYKREEQPLSRLVLVEPGREARVLMAEPRQYLFPRISPDGKRVAVAYSSGATVQPNVHVIDLESGGVTQLTRNGGNYHEWTRDGNRVLYSKGESDGRWLWWQAADPSGSEESLFRADSTITAPGAIPRGQRGAVEAAAAPDGHGFVIRMNLPDGNRDLWYWRRGSAEPARRLVDTPDNDFGPKISPDGRWVAWYVRGDQSGPAQVFVASLPTGEPRYQISTISGAAPVWAPDGKSLFYVRGDALLAARLAFAPRLTVIGTDTLFTGGYGFAGVFHAGYDVTPDGRAFVVPQPVPGSGLPSLTFVHGWSNELRARLAGASPQARRRDAP